MKYLGCPDAGEWWHDRQIDAPDLGLGVRVYIRLADSDGDRPHIINAYGLREDADIEAINRGAQKEIEKYIASGETVSGPLIPCRPEDFYSLDQVMACYEKTCERGVHPSWSVTFLLLGCTGYAPTMDRVIEKVGMEKLEEIRARGLALFRE